MKNIENKDINLGKLVFPAVDSIKIFDFIDEVKSCAVNNALVPFRDFGDIESYLRQQWAGMMFDFLNLRNEARRVQDTLATLSEMNSRIEILSKQILVSVGTEDAKIDAELYEEMLTSEAIRDLAYCKVRPTPINVLVNASYRQCAKSLGLTFNIEDIARNSIGRNGDISRPRFEDNSHEYKRLRQRMISILKAHGTTPEKYRLKHPAVAASEISDDGGDD